MKRLFAFLLTVILFVAPLNGLADKLYDAYEKAEKLFYQGQYEEAISAFSSIEYCKDARKYIMYAKAVLLAEQGEYDLAISNFDSLLTFHDSALQSLYYSARKLEASGDLRTAQQKYLRISGYRDAMERHDALKYRVAAGDYVTFGHYEQDGDSSNGLEPISWLVLELNENNHALLISTSILDFQQYHHSRTDVTWETCFLREWLNVYFLNTAFNATEQNAILTTQVDNSASQNKETYCIEGNNTEDKIYLLSYAEIRKYRSMISDYAPMTPYSRFWASQYSSYIEDTEPTWVRTSSSTHSDSIGWVYFTSYNLAFNADDFEGVRPVLWVDLDSKLISK